MVKSLSDIKAEEGHDIESAVNENTLIAGETSAGVFGVFKLFEGVKKALNNITTISGNKTFSNNVTVSGTFKSNGLIAYPFSITKTYNNSSAANISLASVIPNYTKASMGHKLRGCFATSHVGVSVVATTNQENLYTTFAQNVTGTFTVYGMIYVAQ